MKRIGDWLKKYRKHFIFWIVYISYESAFAEIVAVKHGAPLAYITHYGIVLIFFYLHCNIALPFSLKHKSHVYWLLPLVCLTEIAAYSLTYYADDIFLEKFHIFLMDGKASLHIDYWIIRFYRAGYYLIMSSTYYYIHNYMNETKRSEELERQRLNEIIYRQRIEQELTRAQNAFLKAQINPHFLFNTLDFVYHNVMELSPKAADAIISLSEMMRFAIDSDKMGEFISIGDEIEQVQNLQYLNRLRKSEESPLKLIYPEEVCNLNFIPLVLLTLAENIFKHGSMNSGYDAIMELYVEDGLFIIQTDNLSSRSKPTTSHRTGLLNIEKRLKYAYGDSVYFHYHQDADDHFRLVIKVPLQQLKSVAAPSPVFAGIGTV